MRSGPAATAGLLLGLALLLPACGDEQTVAAAGETTVSNRAEAPVSKAGPGAPAAAKRCRASLGDFLDSIESLGNSLAVGLSYDDYLDAVNRVRGTYAEVDPDRLPLVCLADVAGPAEQALNVYIDAANEWGDCLAAASCELESVEPALQRKWSHAADVLSSARSGLRGLS